MKTDSRNNNTKSKERLNIFIYTPDQLLYVHTQTAELI